MKSGGTRIEWRPERAQNTGDREFTRQEIERGLQGVPEGSTVGEGQTVWFNNNPYRWADLRRIIEEAAQQHLSSSGLAGVAVGENLSPSEVITQLNGQNGLRPSADALLTDMEQNLAELQNAQAAFTEAERQATANPRNTGLRTAAQRARDRVAQLENQRRQMLAQARNMGVAESRLGSYSRLVGESPRGEGANGSGTGNSGFRAMTVSPTFQPQLSPIGGGQVAQNAQAARGIGVPGGFGPGGYGDPMFSGLQPPSSSAYGAALYMDSMISDGLGGLGKSQREGMKLMLLFFYYARMAESGDPVAMYQFVKFLNFVIAKDKARQNIQIGSKLIQLQDLSRKSTEALMATDTTDPEKINDFTKALHKAKAEETTIATSQKLLSDTLQEFNGVTESMANLMKGTQDTAFRIQRTLSQRA